MSTYRGSPLSWSVLKVAGAGLLAFALSGCGVGSLIGGPSTTGSVASAQSTLADSSAPQSEITAMAQNALPAIATECPPIKVRNGAEALFSYANNKVGDPRQLRYQAVIDKQSRNCIVSNGLITVKMGVIGRVLLGPAGSPAEYTVPLRFAVERDDLAVFSQVYDIPVQMTADEQNKEFVKIVENVAIPYLGGENIVIWVGFDGSKT